MSTSNNFSTLRNTWNPQSNVNSTTWDPYPQWQTQCNRENFVRDSRCCDGTNFRPSSMSWTPDKINYAPDMNHNISLSFTPFKK